MLPNVGSIAVFLYLTLMYMKDRAEEQKSSREERAKINDTFLSQLRGCFDRLDVIEANHRNEERADREQNKQLFDRVIAICSDLSKAVSTLDAGVRGLSTATQANERAIVDLREEMTKLREMGVRHPTDEPQPRRRTGPPRGPEAGSP